VWLGRITTAQFLEKLDQTFQQEKAQGKVPAVPAR
jgi:raffinose/stachyose/melibiose transport system substrate-binding protein